MQRREVAVFVLVTYKYLPGVALSEQRKKAWPGIPHQRLVLVRGDRHPTVSVHDFMQSLGNMKQPWRPWSDGMYGYHDPVACACVLDWHEVDLKEAKVLYRQLPEDPWMHGYAMSDLVDRYDRNQHYCPFCAEGELELSCSVSDAPYYADESNELRNDLVCPVCKVMFGAIYKFDRLSLNWGDRALEFESQEDGE